MAIVTSAGKQNPLEGFVPVAPDFINSLIKSRDPLFFEPDKDENSLSSLSAVDKNKEDTNSQSSDDVEFIGEVEKSSTEKSPLKVEKSDLPILKSTLQSSNKPSTSNDSPEKCVPLVNDECNKEVSDNGQFGPNDDHSYCANNDSDVICIDSSEPTVSGSGENHPIIILEDKEETEKLEASSEQLSVSLAEIEYRRKLAPSFDVKNCRLHCTICDIHIGLQMNLTAQSAMLHKDILVLICDKCNKFISHSNFSKFRSIISNESNYCKWCGKLILGVSPKLNRCTSCPSAFCEDCITKNLGSNELRRVVHHNSWKCYLCESKPIWGLRMVAWKAICHIRQRRKMIISGVVDRNLAERLLADTTSCCRPHATSSKSGSENLNGPNTEIQSSSQPIILRNESVPLSGSLSNAAPVPWTQQSSYSTPLLSLFSDIRDPNEAPLQNNVLVSDNSARPLSQFALWKQQINANRIILQQVPTASHSAFQAVNLHSLLTGNNGSNNSNFQVHRLESFERKNDAKRRKVNSSLKNSRMSRAISAFSKELELCRRHLQVVDKMTKATNHTFETEIKLANKLHSLAQMTISKIQEIDCNVLEQYRSVREEMGNGPLLSYDAIGEEYSRIFVEPEIASEDVNPGTFLEVAMSENEYNQHENMKLSQDSRKELFVKLQRCDKVPLKKQIFKATKRAPVMYSRKIENLIRKYRISDCTVIIEKLKETL